MLSEEQATSAESNGAHGKRELAANSPTEALRSHMR